MLKNKYIRNSLIILVVTLSLLLTDLLLKHYLYKPTSGLLPGQATDTQWNITVIAGRSLLHDSSTFLDFVHLTMPRWASLLVNYLVAVLFISMGFFSKSKRVAISASVTLAGIFGNAMDATFLDGVRDIFFLPWWDRGTFNFADCIVVLGAAVTALSYLSTAWRKEKAV